MPRLTDKQYLKYRKYLRKLWLTRTGLYANLLPTQQWQIHEYFRPDEELTDKQLLAHRKDITAQYPSLPHQAGRTIKEFGQMLRAKAPSRATKTTITNKRGQTNTIRTGSVVRPQIDIPMLARVLIELEKH